ncbi:hypothetical protein A33Q_0910 [Indibacter alkaliphilus LW1]|uniref:Uncharacterized protein n=1 Tax=Indibacter alkaliphilus (strain CCUG 57479 / KCTC 22604 / LW1) TaxID=1189612 RepID=S2DIX0_INDAL|nr:hypothetical protein [Indibacter alkaliphilus]EOZ98927.1 hypothetical protein A33Q_0910 [Indibacter alkaliphilus LW1]
MNAVKLIVSIVIYLIVNQYVEGQNLKEWFMQQKTQIEYLVSQNAALRVLNGTIRKGYSEKGFGLGLINEDLQGEFGLHTSHYLDFEALPPNEHERLESEIKTQLDQLENLSFAVRKMINRSGIPIRLQQGLMQLHSGINKVLQQKKSQAEILLSQGELEMDDAERLERLTALGRALTETEKDLRRLVLIYEGILQHRMIESTAINQSKTLYP